jgi:uncharacterized protein (TIGR03067 family)
MRQLLVILGAVVVLVAPACGDDQEKPDKDKLQGEWEAVSSAWGGKGLPADVVKKTKLLFKGDEYVLSRNGRDYTVGFRLDPTKTPKEFDAQSAAGGKGKAEVRKGIYKLEGDTLTICAALHAEGDRPKEFKSSDGVELSVYKQASKK